MANIIERKGGKVASEIPYVIFKENDQYVAYSPALDLATCGDTEKNAHEMFADASQTFIDDITEMDTPVLKPHGWINVDEGT